MKIECVMMKHRFEYVQREMENRVEITKEETDNIGDQWVYFNLTIEGSFDISDLFHAGTKCGLNYSLVQAKSSSDIYNTQIIKTIKIKVMSKSTTVKNTGKRGRPTVSNSARQARLAARAARVAAGGEVKRGRPASQGSARQAKLAAQAARIAAGETIKRGRPAKQVEVVA